MDPATIKDKIKDRNTAVALLLNENLPGYLSLEEDLP